MHKNIKSEAYHAAHAHRRQAFVVLVQLGSINSAIAMTGMHY